MRSFLPSPEGVLTLTVNQHLPRTLAGAVLVSLVLLASGGFYGCGSDLAPVAVAPPASDEPGGKAFLVFTPQVIQRGAKLAIVPEEGLMVSRVIGPHGGTLQVKDRGGEKREIEDDLQVALEVPRGALSERVEISMTVQGNLLSELVAIFAPDGLVFARSAVLTFALGMDRVDFPLSQLRAYHVDSEGNVEPARILAIETFGRGAAEKGCRISIEVPGFSRYPLDQDDGP